MDDYRVPQRVKHIPLHPARPCTPGEGIYLELWREWAEANPREWRAIFCTTGPVRQRAASVAASFMVFMGCNGGRCFTLQAQKLAAADHYKERAFLAAWSDCNKRSRGVNSGLRTIEYMLAREHPIASNGIAHCVDWRRVPDVTMDDIDVVESMVCWWAGLTAQVMRDIAEPMIEAAMRKMRAGIFTRVEHPGSAHG
mgnify:CR=1 FL=1